MANDGNTKYWCRKEMQIHSTRELISVKNSKIFDKLSFQMMMTKKKNVTICLHDCDQPCEPHDTITLHPSKKCTTNLPLFLY